MDYGNAFKIVRQIKKIPLKEASASLGIDERSLRDIEGGKTTLITERFGQLLDYYGIDYKLIFELAEDSTTLNNVVHEAKRDGIVVNQGGFQQFSSIEARVVQLEQRLYNIDNKLVALLDLLNHLLQRSESKI